MKLRLSLKINTPTILIVNFMLAFFFAKTLAMPSLVANGLIAGTGLLNLGYCMLKRSFPAKYFLIGAFFSLSMMLSILYNSNASWMELLWVWCFLGVALVLAQWTISSATISKVFIVVLAVFAVQIISGVDPQKALAGISGNNISIIILFFVILIYIKRDEENKKISYWPCAAAILLSLWGNGRAGLLASGLLTVLLFLYDYINVSKFRISTLLRIGIVGAIAFMLVQHYFGDYLASLTDKIDRYGYTSSRTDIWAEYLRAALRSVPNLLFGVLRDTSTPLLNFYGGNVHNAFLALHSNYGIFCLIFVLVSLVKSLFVFLRHKKLVYAIMIIVWCCRSIFDWTGFPGIFDVLFFYFLIQSDMLQRNASQRR